MLESSTRNLSTPNTDPEIGATNTYDCIDYVFARVMHEPWCTPSENHREHYRFALSFFPISFLIEKGYAIVSTPHDGDVVAYGDLSANRTGYEIKHFGVYRDNQVVSQWGIGGPVRRHRLGQVSPTYGAPIYLFRKTK